MKTVKRFSVILLVFSMLCLTGCWNYRELDNLSMVSGFAVDKGTEGHKYHLTFEFLDLTKNQTNGKLLETEGDTIFDGIRNAISKSQKKLFFSDCKVIIISQDIAREGLAPIFDWITRDAEPRISLNPVISKEKTAADLLQQKPITDQLITQEIWKTLVQNTITLSENPDVKLYQAIDMLGSEGSSLILPAAKVAKTQSETNFELDGSAVFKKDKLLGFLDRNDSKYVLFIKDQVGGGLLLTNPDSSDYKVSLEIAGNQTSVTPEFTDTGVTINIEIKMKAYLAEDQTSKEYSTTKDIKKVEKSAEKTLKDGVSGVIKKVQDLYGSDIFGFGETIYQNSPEKWNKIKPGWDTAFHTLKYTVTTHVAIQNTATANKKIKVG